MVETINKYTRVSRQLLQELGRDPLPEEEIAKEMNMSESKVREYKKDSSRTCIFRNSNRRGRR